MIGTRFYKNNLIGRDYADCAIWCNENNATIVDKGEYYECVELAIDLDESKQEMLTELGEEFANRRDRVRWVEISSGTYGFDCASEDMTNFFSALKGFDFDETMVSTPYKVWLTETTKGLIQLTKADFAVIYNTVRSSQLEDYAWYETIKSQIVNAESIGALTNLNW